MEEVEVVLTEGQWGLIRNALFVAVLEGRMDAPLEPLGAMRRVADNMVLVRDGEGQVILNMGPGVLGLVV